ncbi:MAG: hypothetical protein IKR69_05730 [Bacteroidales bacterium]|nr:hypothetical protein [Bacteroidales bacterium]
MDQIIKIYDKFSAMMVDTPVEQWPGRTFSEICRSLGADEAALDAYIKEETGFTGDEIVARCCK